MSASVPTTGRAPASAAAPLLEVSDLRVASGPRKRPRVIVRGVSFTVRAGEVHGLVGESGSGKSLTVMAVNGLLPEGVWLAGGSVKFNGEELVGISPQRWTELHGAQIGMVFQDSLAALNPVIRIGGQVAEPLVLHHVARKKEALHRAARQLAEMGIPDVDEAVRRYAHEFSGGMRQRAAIAASLVAAPRLIIADEPTTALDVTVQAQILRIFRQMNEELGVAIVLISHDLGVLSEVCTTISVMYAGRIVETGKAQDLLARPNHPYTRALVESMPSTDRGAAGLNPIRGEPPSPDAWPEGCKFHPRCTFAKAKCAVEEPSLEPTGVSSTACWVAQAGELPEFVRERGTVAGPARSGATEAGEVILGATGLRRYFRVRGTGLFAPAKHVKALDGVSLQLNRGDTLGVVGESGCGKSTLARCLLRLVEVEEGQILFMGRDITHLSGPELRRMRRYFQPIFQDPFASLNPRARIADIVAEPLQVSGTPKAEARLLATEALHRVGITERFLDRRPHELSGGQRQRVGIARAIVMKPDLIIADEPISSLDVSIQAQVINLLANLQRQLNLTMIFISHDLRVVRYLCSTIAVMFLGKVVETGPTEEIYTRPRHPYTAALLASVPNVESVGATRQAARLKGEPPSPISPPSGCRFRTRCAYAQDKCATEEPLLEGSEPGSHQWACHFPLAVPGVLARSEA